MKLRLTSEPRATRHVVAERADHARLCKSVIEVPDTWGERFLEVQGEWFVMQYELAERTNRPTGQGG